MDSYQTDTAVSGAVDQANPSPKIADDCGPIDVKYNMIEKCGDLNCVNLVDQMKRLNEAWPNKKARIEDLSEIYVQWTQVFEHLGPALAYSFKDCREKAQDMIDNIDVFAHQLKVIDPNSDEAKYVIPFTQIEAQYKIQVLNKDDNKSIIKKHFKKEDVQPWMKKYASTSRHLWRTQWFYEFVGQMLQAIVMQRDQKLPKLAKNVYVKYLSPHHNAVLSKVAQVAMSAVRSREKFIGGLVEQQSRNIGQQLTDEDIYRLIGQMSQEALLLSQYLLADCHQYGFTELP